MDERICLYLLLFNWSACSAQSAVFNPTTSVYRAEKNVKFTDSYFSRVKVRSVTQCCLTCEEDPNCGRVNFYTPVSSTLSTCDLISGIDGPTTFLAGHRALRPQFDVVMTTHEQETTPVLTTTHEQKTTTVLMTTHEQETTPVETTPALTTPHIPACPVGYTTVSSRCYKVNISQKMLYLAAKTWCNKQGGYLACLESVTEKNDVISWLNSVYPGKEFQLGVEKIGSTYTWLTGSTYVPWDESPPHLSGGMLYYQSGSFVLADSDLGSWQLDTLCEADMV